MAEERRERGRGKGEKEAKEEKEKGEKRGAKMIHLMVGELLRAHTHKKKKAHLTYLASYVLPFLYCKQ